MKFSSEQWLAWLGSTVVAAVIIVVFAYTNFETKADADNAETRVEKRLERIEGKIDSIMEKK